MPLLRLILAGLVALFAMLAVAFTAAVVLFTGLVGWIMQLFGGGPGPARRGPMPGRPMRRGPRTNMASGDVIDVETTKVPDDGAGR